MKRSAAFWIVAMLLALFLVFFIVLNFRGLEILKYTGNAVGAGVQKNILEGLRPPVVPPQQALAPKATLIVLIRTNVGDNEGVVDATISLVNYSGDVVASKGTKGARHVIFTNLPVNPQKGKKSEPFMIKIESLDWESWDEYVKLEAGKETVAMLYLSKKKSKVYGRCFDSDEGNASLIRGTAKIKRPVKLGGSEERTDFCQGSTLIEYYCTEDQGEEKIGNASVFCPGGCLEGACQVTPYCGEDNTCMDLNASVCYDFNQRWDAETTNPFKISTIELRENLDLLREPDKEDETPPARIIPSRPIAGNAVAEAAPAQEAPVLKDGKEENKVPARDIWTPPKELILSSYCANPQEVMHYSCSAATSLGNDISIIPKNESVLCPSGYHCGKGKCIQDERGLPSNLGDVNRDSAVDGKDVDMLAQLTSKEEPGYYALADIDGDKFMDYYDLFKLRKIVVNKEPINAEISPRILKLSTNGETLYHQDTYALGNLQETRAGGSLKSWKAEYQQKGNSRSNCKPPVLNIKFPKKDKFQAMTTYAGLGILGYKKVRFIPDCDILSTHEVDNQLREYLIYSALRTWGVPTLDVLGFAEVKFASPDKSIEPTRSYNYLLLQRDDEEEDAVPFMKQFSLREILQEDYNDNIRYEWGDWDNEANDRFSKITLYKEKLEAEKNNAQRSKQENEAREEIDLELDPDTSIRYFLISDFFDLGDRSILWNEHYGYSTVTNNWRSIPFDLDSSLLCNMYLGGTASAILNLPEEKRDSYYIKLDAAAREIFDNPDNLNYLLSLVDSYPFEENKDKMKNTLRWRFYYAALYFGSKEFANEIGKTHVPFTHQAQYEKEARRILALDSYDTMCSDSYPDYAMLRKVLDRKEGANF